MTRVEIITPIVKLNLKLQCQSLAYVIIVMRTYFVSGTITAPNTGTEANPNSRKSIIIKKFAPFTDCISRINNTQINNAKDIDVVMPMYNLIEYNNSYSKTSGSLWQYYRDERALDANGVIIDFPANDNNSASFKFKKK